MDNQNPAPQVNPGGVVQLPDGRFVPEAQYTETMSHAQAMGAPDPYVDPDRAVSVPVTQPEAEDATEEMTEATSDPSLAVEAETVEEDVQVPTTDDPEGTAGETDEAVEATPETVIAEQARALSEEGWSDEAIDAWTEMPQEIREWSNPDGTVKLEHFDPKEMTERQEKLVYAEVMTKGELNPAYAKAFAEAYNVSIDVVQQFIATTRNAEYEKAHRAAANDRGSLGMTEQAYGEMTNWFNQLPAEQRTNIEAELADPGLRAIALQGVRVMWERDLQAKQAEAPAPVNNTNMKTTLPNNVAPVQQADGTWVLKRVNR